MRTHIQKILLSVAGLLIVAMIFFGSRELPAITDNTTTNTSEIATTSNNAPEKTVPVQQKITKEKVTNNENIAKEYVAVTFITPNATYETVIEKGSSAYDLMEELRDTQKLLFDSEYYTGIGFFITSLSGIKQNPKNSEYWTLYINEKESQVGVSAYILKNGDSVEWKLEDRNNL